MKGLNQEKCTNSENRNVRLWVKGFKWFRISAITLWAHFLPSQIYPYGFKVFIKYEKPLFIILLLQIFMYCCWIFFIHVFINKLSHLMTKPTELLLHPAKTWSAWASVQSDQSGRPVWSVFAVRSLSSKDPRFLHADSEDSDQTGRMPRLIWVFSRRTVILLVLSWGGSTLLTNNKARYQSVMGAVMCRHHLHPV